MIGTGKTAGPVTNNKGDGITGQCTLYGQEATGLISGVHRFKHIRLQKTLCRSEQLRVIKQGAIHTAGVGTFDMYKTHSFLLQSRLVHQIGQCTGILHLRYSDDGSSHIGQTVCSQLRQYRRHIFELRKIFQTVPASCSLRQVLIVIFSFIMNGIEQIFQIIKPNGIHGVFFLLCKSRQQHATTQNKEPKSLHKISYFTFHFKIQSTNMQYFYEFFQLK